MTDPETPKNYIKPKSPHWRKKASPFSAQYVQRQGQVVHLAHSLLGDRDLAIAFLNSFHAGLGAKPLDLAGGSAAGCLAVEGEIQLLASSPAHACPESY